MGSRFKCKAFGLKEISLSLLQVKRLVSIILLFSFLGSTTEVHELFKVPHLIFHYFTHKAEQKEMALLDFIDIHYEHDHDHEKSEDEHHDKGCLPFQGEHQCSLNTITAISHVADELFVPVAERETATALYSYPYSSNFLSAIWQPPKIG